MENQEMMGTLAPAISLEELEEKWHLKDYDSHLALLTFSYRNVMTGLEPLINTSRHSMKTRELSL